MAGRTRSRGVTYGQLMLFAALLFGIVTMHTVGHPAEHGGATAVSTAFTSEATASGTSASQASASPAASSSDASSSSPAGAGHAPPAHAPAPASAPGLADAPHPSSHDVPGAGGDAPLSGMDPLSVCLAVLGVWTLALAGSRLFGLRADGRPLGTPVGAGLLRVLRPHPPSPIPVLAGISVLRI
ncbi:hypothetical protein AB0E21_15580 [Streptomyces sp. NPDC047967]|uniref:hypothetical protein n=1 Tax=Streptomyces sp. NPDC047967 TaxID=3154924 RepID=UPI0033F63321